MCTGCVFRPLFSQRHVGGRRPILLYMMIFGPVFDTLYCFLTRCHRGQLPIWNKAGSGQDISPPSHITFIGCSSVWFLHGQKRLMAVGAIFRLKVSSETFSIVYTICSNSKYYSSKLIILQILTFHSASMQYMYCVLSVPAEGHYLSFHSSGL